MANFKLLSSLCDNDGVFSWLFAVRKSVLNFPRAIYLFVTIGFEAVASTILAAMKSFGPEKNSQQAFYRGAIISVINLQNYINACIR